jgi:hypothetical protein
MFYRGRIFRQAGKKGKSGPVEGNVCFSSMPTQAHGHPGSATRIKAAFAVANAPESILSASASGLVSGHICGRGRLAARPDLRWTRRVNCASIDNAVG